APAGEPVDLTRMGGASDTAVIEGRPGFAGASPSVGGVGAMSGPPPESIKIFPDYTFGAHAAEVEVDTETGRVRLLKYVAAHDVGKAINPQSGEGQIQGGAVQGLGYGMMEEVLLEDGINLTTSFSSYLIPTSADVADVDAVVVESGEGL